MAAQLLFGTRHVPGSGWTAWSRPFRRQS